MYAVLATRATLARFGPWIGRVAKQSPQIIDQAYTKIVSSGKSISPGISGLKSFFTSSPINAALVLSTLASLGVSVWDLFDDDAKKDTLTGEFISTLDDIASTFNATQRRESEKMILDIGAESEKLKVGLADREVETLTAIDVLSWARSHYGSPVSAMRAHRLSQAFQEMAYEDVRTGFATLRLN